MRAMYQRATAGGITAVAFGDLFLQDIRDYRVRQLQESGLEPLFPVWQIPTEQLSGEVIAAGVRAKIACVDPSKLAKFFAGREYYMRLLQALPPGIDPCGENGEFHTFAYDAPSVFSSNRSADGRSGRVRWICICRLNSAMTGLCKGGEPDWSDLRFHNNVKLARVFSRSCLGAITSHA
jgi:diphthamide synthase (EF-2-diphthine--ammonia ligase)